MEVPFNNSFLIVSLFSPEKEKGLKKRAKLYPQENGEKSENGLSRENEERRENGDGDSDNEPEGVREKSFITTGLLVTKIRDGFKKKKVAWQCFMRMNL